MPWNRRMEIQEHDGIITFRVRVAPRASRDAIEGEYQDSLKVRLTAPPVDDRANEALRKLIAGRLNVPVSAVKIVAGTKARTKRIAVIGVTQEQVAALTVPSAKRIRKGS
ncbi:MAG: DUF167 domain-containing protein [Terracidiphilus sp.]